MTIKPKDIQALSILANAIREFRYEVDPVSLLDPNHLSTIVKYGRRMRALLLNTEPNPSTFPTYPETNLTTDMRELWRTGWYNDSDRLFRIYSNQGHSSIFDIPLYPRSIVIFPPRISELDLLYFSTLKEFSLSRSAS